MRRLVLTFSIACSSPAERAPEVDVELAAPEPALTAKASVQEVVPPVPITAASLVAEGQHWRIVTPRGPVHVWVSKGYKARRADTIVDVHGYYTHVDQAWSDHNLPFQFAASTINAMFIACEAPAGLDEPVA